MQQQIAWYFKDEVAPEEYARQESELLARNSQISVHRQRSKSDVVAVEYRDHEQKEDKWYDARPYFADCSGFDCVWSKCWTGAHAAPRDRSAQCSTEISVGKVNRTESVDDTKLRAYVLRQ